MVNGRLEEARKEHQQACDLIAEGEYLSHYRGHHERRDKLAAEIKDLEIANAKELAGEAAIEFLREHGKYLHSEFDDITTVIGADLERALARIATVEELESEL